MRQQGAGARDGGGRRWARRGGGANVGAASAAGKDPSDDGRWARPAVPDAPLTPPRNFPG